MPALCAVALLAGCSEKNDSQLAVPESVTEAPKVVVDYDELKKRDSLWHFEGKLFTGIAVEEKKFVGQKFKRPFKDGKLISTKEWDEDGNTK